MDYLRYQFKSLEKIPTKVWESAREGSIHVARSIALAIRQKQQEGEHIVLGLATGSSPIQVYKELVRMHREEGLSFANVITFNLDEYFPMQPDAPQSYVRFMREFLFDHIDIKPENIHIPDGTLPLEQVEAYCARYEKMIQQAGGIDIQILGIGRTGHIAFNEPGSFDTSVTRLIRLDATTRRDASKDFPSIEEVPYRAITMGIRTIMRAKAIYLMAWGQHKSEVVRHMVEGEVSPSVPASFLQQHANAKVYLDRGAAEDLARFRTPWLVGLCNWDDDLICKAVTWLSLTLGKSILKLTGEDYNEHGLSDLVVEHSSAYDINIRVFNRLQHTITGWPGGKPGADDSTRPERAKPPKKRAIIFSPHPDDDVISMGGTFLRLVEQGHEVHVAYQTSGNIAVHDYDALRYLEFHEEFCSSQSMGAEGAARRQELIKFLREKSPFEIDLPEIRKVKGLIRRGEARAGARFCGLEDANIHFLDLPFYETGKTRKNPVGEEDIRIVAQFMEKIKPNQVFAAGDLADPHGTHSVCLDAIFAAFESLKDQKWAKECWLWLYRGAWHEWAVDEIEMAVPMSPEQVLKKRRAIFMHQSQKDRPPFPGSDVREFWQRAEDRNRGTAKTYRQLGLAEYEAIEAFRRWKFPWQAAGK
ncbi:MAG: glucosamine-6-phosphate deaminase [Saprospiraceae bacterium]|jgi:glucosamine-6-phosphate deaminase